MEAHGIGTFGETPTFLEVVVGRGLTTVQLEMKLEMLRRKLFTQEPLGIMA